jgi:hypothetical protein
MPNWKKVITSGSDASLNTLTVVNGITGSLFGTASYALTASNISPVISNDADTRLVTANGNGTLSGEGNLQFDGNTLKVLYQSGDEGGEILMAKPVTNTTIAGTGVTVDIYQNKLRFFEQGGSARGYYLDITAGGAGVATNLASGGGTVTSVSASGTVSGITLGGGPITGAGTLTLSGTISGLTNSNLSGTAGITNANLANPSLMVGSTNIALGATGSLLAGLTSISATSFTGSLLGTASYALQALSSSFATTASYALTAGNGGVTKIIAGANVNLSPVSGLGDVTVTAFGTNLYNTATGSYGSFYDTGSVLATSATTIYSMSLSTTDISNGVFVSASGGDITRVKFTNAGTYNVQFSSQFSNSDNSTQDVVVWFRKNGTDIPDSSGTVGVPPFKAGSNGQVIASWNYYVSISANDFIQLCWHAEQANVITLETIAAGTSPTHPRTPSTILTATRVDTFLSNTGSFSGSFTGILTGTASYASQALSSSFATTASYVLNAVSASYATTATTTAAVNGTVTCIPYFNTSTSLANTDIILSGSNYGISINTPRTKLMINNGDLSAYNTSGSGPTGLGAQMYLGDGNFQNANYYNSAPGIGAVYSPLSGVMGDLALYTYNNLPSNRSENMRLFRGGGVGIGTSITSSYKLDVVGTSRFNGSMSVTGSVIATSFTGSLLGTASFATTASYASTYAPVFPYTGSAIITGSLRVTGSTEILDGNLILNTSSVASAGSWRDSPSILTYGSVWNSAIGPMVMNGGFKITPSTSPIGFNTNPTIAKLSFLVGTDNSASIERMYISSQGKLGVNGGGASITGSLVVSSSVDTNQIIGNTNLTTPATAGGTVNIVSLNNTPTLTFSQAGTAARLQITVIGGSQEQTHFKSNVNVGEFNWLNNSTNYLGRLTTNGNLLLPGSGSTTQPVDAGYRLDVSGSARIRGYANTSISSSLVVLGSGSSQPIFTVQGSQGELFSVTDSLSGSLFSVNDISGLPVLEAFSDNTVLLGSYQAPALLTTNKIILTASGNFTLSSLPTASYDGAFYDYTARSGSNARAGSIMAIWGNGGTVNFTETTTTDFGNTTGLNLGVFVIGGNMVLTGSASTTAWTIKTIIRSI